MSAGDGAALHAVGGGSTSDGRRDRHVVVVAPARGDAGNAAVLEALLELSDDVVDVVLGDESVPAPVLSRRSTVRTLPGLLGGSRDARSAALLRVERLLAGAARCTLIAPDTIADRDDVHAFVRCVALVRAAAERGVDARIIGLTWNLGGGNAGVTALHAAVRDGVQLYMRDDFSLMRAMNAGLVGLRLAADLALAARHRDSALLAEAGLTRTPYALLTVCAALVPGGDPAADYVAVAERLQRRGLRVVLQPSAQTGYDLLLLGRVARALPTGTTVVRRALTGGETRALVGSAQLVVTDRTRTTVLALSAETRVLGLATRRELEALLRTAAMGERSVLPKPGFSRPVGELAERLLDERELPCGSRLALAELRALALVNLDGLPRAAIGQHERATG